MDVFPNYIHCTWQLHMNNNEAYLNLGCLLMASSGKNSDLDTPFSTGVGAYSGLVKPGQPNLHKGGKTKLKQCFNASSMTKFVAN